MEADKSLVSGSMALLVLKLLEDGDKYGYTAWRKKGWSPPTSGRPLPVSPGGTTI